ncbi:MAG: TrkA family potassium uptake protein [Sedimentibacter sp.]|uniref:potassium channel family protein n=1 Tax=Sedimentibacter sp. TaxID=1960295 RepID=UPI0031580A08
MYIIIIGCGRLGSNLARQLSDEGHDVCIIDRDSNKLNVLGSGFNGLRLKGIEFDNDKLSEAGIAQADTVLAVSSDDNINITVSLIADKIYHVPNVIARVNEPGKEYIYDKLAIKTLKPINIGISNLKRMLSLNKVNEVYDIGEDLEIADVLVSRDMKTTVDSIEKSCSCLISCIISGKDRMIPQKEQSVRWGDRIICTIPKNNMDTLLNMVSRGTII